MPDIDLAGLIFDLRVHIGIVYSDLDKVLKEKFVDREAYCVCD